MALVSQNIVNQWYKKDSWVYKHFSYLFSNPIWQTKIPSGYSLCPLFWMALFSLFVFRPFIIPFLGLIKYACKVSSPLKRFLEFSDNFVFSKLSIDGSCLLGTATILGGLLVSLASLVLFLLFNIVKGYAENDALAALIIPIIISTSFIYCSGYKNDALGRTCNTRYHFYTILVLSIAAAYYFMPDSLLSTIKGTISIILFLVSEIFGALMFVVKKAALFIHDFISFLLPNFSPSIFWLFSAGFLTVFGTIGFFFSKMLETKIVKASEREEWMACYGEFKYFTEWAYANTPCGMDTAKKITKKINYSAIFLDYYSNKISLDELNENIIKIFKVESMKEYEKQNIEAKIRQDRANRSNDMCRRFQAQIEKTLYPMKWLFNQSKIWLAMMREVMAARKQGFCPYKKFED